MASIFPTTSNTSYGGSSSSKLQNPSLNLKPTDFLNLMVKQLQNQDPTKPTSSADLLAQMSQIGQLQSSTSLQTTLQSFGLQTSLSSASSMIGKMVTGMDGNSKPIQGLVTSVQVQGGAVSLELDNGNSMPLANVSSIAPGPTGTGAASSSTSGVPAGN